jgi:serine/threonine protein kinase
MLTQNSSEKVLKSEVEIQSSLNHPNILSLYTWFHDETKIYLVLEFALNGNVLKKLDKEKQLSDTVASAVSFLGGKDSVNFKKLFFTSTFIKQQKH